MTDTYGAERDLKRFEGFTDAVFAIALTLLVVEIKPPGAPDGPHAGASLLHAMTSQWREHLALALSFLAIGAYWLQHHYTGRIYAKSDHLFGLINLGFLLAVVVLPYPLRIWCFHLGTEHYRTASITLTAGLLLPALFWMLKWFYAKRHGRLIDRRLAPDYVAQMTRRYGLGAVVQAAAVPVSAAAPTLGVALALAVVGYFLAPQPKPRYKEGQAPDENEVASD
jgi:uncharacterized membrane protein